MPFGVRACVSEKDLIDLAPLRVRALRGRISTQATGTTALDSAKERGPTDTTAGDSPFDISNVPPAMGFFYGHFIAVSILTLDIVQYPRRLFH